MAALTMAQRRPITTALLTVTLLTTALLTTARLAKRGQPHAMLATPKASSALRLSCAPISAQARRVEAYSTRGSGCACQHRWRR